MFYLTMVKRNKYCLYINSNQRAFNKNSSSHNFMELYLTATIKLRQYKTDEMPLTVQSNFQNSRSRYDMTNFGNGS